jgi:hypothetical protein
MRRQAHAALLVAVLVLAGCAALPHSGSVERVAAVGSRTHSTVRYQPARPPSGMAPQQIVEGYLDAMLAYPEAAGIVQSYLTPEAVEDWDSAAGYTVYTRVSTSLADVGTNEAEVVVRSHDVLKIDEFGRAAPEATDTTRTFRLERVGGQWRVANPVPGSLISRQFAKDYIRSYLLWFFDESSTRLVPELLHAVVSEQLPVTLVRRVAAGPRLGTLRTYLPTPDSVRVTIAGTMVQVDFRSAPQGAADKFAAQLVSTLRGVPGFDGVRILVGGVPQGDLHPLDAVVGFGPGPLASKVYAIRDGRVVEVTGSSRPVRGPWGRSSGRVVGLAVNGASIAVVRNGRNTVAVGRLKSADTTTYTGTRFVDPVWDDGQSLWLVDNPQGVRVRVVQKGQVRNIETDSLETVESFAISPDRSRYAAVEHSDGADTVVVGAIEHDVTGAPTRLLAPIPVSGGRTGERSVGWASASRIDFVAAGKAGPQLYSVGVDGADLSAGDALRGGVTAWAGPAADRAERWALDGRGQLWRRASGGHWRPLGRGVYTVLSSGR